MTDGARNQENLREAGGITVLVDSRRTRWAGQRQPHKSSSRARHRTWLVVTVCVAFAVTAIATVILEMQPAGHSARAIHRDPPRARTALPTKPASYIGVYRTGVPNSYAGVTTFTAKTGIRPRVVVYYSGWFEPFKAKFASTAAEHGAVPLVQINPTGISLAAIASGQYDAYLTSYAQAVRAYHEPVILGFGHEMNGDWYSWGYRHTSPAVFVAAWRHIVTIFRELKVRNVTWLWTVNIIHRGGSIADPARWWPGNRYVTWIGMDGYYYRPSWKFAPLFGPTIASLRQLTHAPILIAETGAASTIDQPAKIADLFAGIRLFGLLGFVWFDSVHTKDWRVNSPAAIAAFRRGAETYDGRAS